MLEEDIIKDAFAEGFHAAKIISTDKIVFDGSFRAYCEENLCGQYGVNYSCPPDCGSVNQMKERVLSHSKALVVSTEWIIDDLSQSDKLRAAKTEHNAAMFRLIKKMRDEGHNGIMIGSSGCTLCRPCKLALGEVCAYPDMRYSCMSAYCIYVKKLAEECEMNYDYKDGVLPFFGMYVYD